MKIFTSFTRIYTNDIDKTISFYETLTTKKCSVRFKYSDRNLELAQVDTFLILGGNDSDLEPFRKTIATLTVDSVSGFREFLLKNGGKIIRDIQTVPTGFNLTMKNPDGAEIEYIQFTK